MKVLGWQGLFRLHSDMQEREVVSLLTNDLIQVATQAPYPAG